MRKLTADSYCDLDEAYLKIEASEIGWCYTCKVKTCHFNNAR